MKEIIKKWDKDLKDLIKYRKQILNDYQKEKEGENKEYLKKKYAQVVGQIEMKMHDIEELEKVV